MPLSSSWESQHRVPGFSSEPGSSWASECKIALLVQMMETYIRIYSPSTSPVPDAVGRTSFGPMPKTRLVGAGARPGVAGTDRTRHGACHLPHWPGNPTQEKSKSWEEPDKRKSKKGGRRGGGGYSKATVPDRERNRHRLNPQLRCQTRFRCELAKQTQSKLGIVHPVLVRYQMHSHALLLVRCRKRVWSVPAPGRAWPERTGPDTEHAIFRIGPEIQSQFELQLDHSRGKGQ